MNIGYDIRSFLSNETGIGIYFKNLINTITTDNSDNYFLLSSSFKERFNNSKLSNSDNYIIKDVKIPVSILNFLWYRLKTLSFSFFFKKDIDLVHSPVPAIIPGNHKNIITVHDLCLFDRPELVSLETIKNFKKDMLYSLNKSDGVIAVSKFTKERILKNFGQQFSTKIKVIYHGSDFDKVQERKPDKKLPDKYLLFVGTIEPRKNIISILKALDKIIKKHKDIKLVICGSRGWDNKQVFELLDKKVEEKKVVLFEYIDRAELKYIYSRASLLVFPSIYEGFGLPILEAAYNGIPVACSDIPVFKEIFNDYPIYFDYKNSEDIAFKINDLLADKLKYNDKKNIAKEIKLKYTWQKAANKTLLYYKEIK